MGNQAKAWTLNLKDSGWDVMVAVRKPEQHQALLSSWGIKSITLNSAEKMNHDYIAILTPDHTHLEILQKNAANIKTGATLLYAHGFSMMEHKLQEKFPQFYHALFAPKAIASELRYQYETKGKLGAVSSLELINATQKKQTSDFIQLLAAGLGITSGPYPTTFKNETMADLFSEQTLLCALIPYASNSVYKKLRSHNIDKELAYFEAWYEVKLIVDTLIKIGPKDFFNLISPNALLGAHLSVSHLVDDDFEQKIDQIWQEIEQGKFQDKLKKLDYNTIKKQIENFWADQELTQTHNELKSTLF